MLSLQALGAAYITDKGDWFHSFRGMSYLDVYAIYFGPLRHKSLSILEIGVREGASLILWHEYFPWAQIYGIDIDPACARAPLLSDRMHIAIGDQGDPVFMAGCFPNIEFDIVIDDGSHINRLTLAAFKSLWPRLKPGGLYCIEDLRCSYERLQSEQDILNIWPGMAFNDPRGDYDNDRKVMDDFFRRGIEALDHGQGEARFLHFWSMLCVMGKAEVSA
jgi:predicted O-methyltransferase YrrM